MVHLAAIGEYVSTHLLSIIVCILATYVIGFTWHGPLFGKAWMKANNIKEPKKEDVTFSMMLPGLSANFVAVFVQAAVLGRTFEMMQLSSMSDALVIATVLWLPFTALTILNTNAWVGRPFLNTALDAGFYLASTLAVAAISLAML